MRTNQSIALELLAGIATGATVTASGVPVPTKGYIVGLAGMHTGEANLSLNMVTEWVRINRGIVMSDTHRYMGIWNDSGEVYLDIVEVYRTLKRAMALAIVRHELAIFNLNGTVITVP